MSSTEGSSDRLFVAVFAALAAVYVLPLLLFRLLPSQDLPNHFAIVATLVRRGPDWNTLFEDRLALAPYSGFYWLSTALARFLGAEIAGTAAG